ncbi:substrate-binding domain-containing protein [Agathobacter sp.]
MKKKLSILLCIVMIASLFAGCGKSNGSTASGSANILIATSSEGDAFRDSLISAIESSCDKQGISHDTEYAGESAEKQVEIVKSAKEKGYTAIICRLVDSDTALQIERAADGLPIVFVNALPDELYLKADQYVYVASDDQVAGEYQAEYVLDKLSQKDEINVMILKGEKSHSATKSRTDAVKNTLNASGKKINYVFEDYADWSTDLAKEYFEIFNSTGRSVDCVICNNDSMAIGAIDGMEECGIDPATVPVCGIDATTDGCQYVKDGKMGFTVCQSAVNQGAAAVDVAVMLANGKSIKDYSGVADNGYMVWVDFEKVDASNVDSYMK